MQLATAEVQGYWGDWRGDIAVLVTFPTKRNGAPVLRYRWQTPCTGARTISGSFATVAAAIARAKRSAYARNVVRP